MKILILGAGRVGRSVAENLVSDANEISVIDNDPERIRTLQDRFDLMGLVGLEVPVALNIITSILINMIINRPADCRDR